MSSAHNKMGESKGVRSQLFRTCLGYSTDDEVRQAAVLVINENGDAAHIIAFACDRG